MSDAPNILAIWARWAGEEVTYEGATVLAVDGEHYVAAVADALAGAGHDRVLLSSGEQSLGPGALEALEAARIESGRPWAAFVGTECFLGRTSDLRASGGLSDDWQAFYWWTDLDVEWVSPAKGHVIEVDHDGRTEAKGLAYYVGLRDHKHLEAGGT